MRGLGTWSLCLGIGSLVLAFGCAGEDPSPAPEVIVAYGHGIFTGAEGRAVEPTVAVARATQEAFIERLAPLAENAGSARELLRASYQDTVIADAVFVRWLADATKPGDYNRVIAVNENLHAWYMSTLPEEQRDGVGTLEEVAARLEGRGLQAIQSALITGNAGRKYISECRAAGVPIPPPLFDKSWVKRGEITNEFISAPDKAELWTYESTNPNGICMALPRYKSNDSIPLLGVICLGRQSNKVCFWDNPRDASLKPSPLFFRGEVHAIEEFEGGADLVTNGGGECSDCHAGENPFIVHPEKPPFMSLPSIMPGSWYDPIVGAPWRQNPGPTYVLDAVSSPSKCTSCHTQGGAGRFPQIQALNAYCGAVLTPALSGGTRTMPPYGMDPDDFEAHIKKLRELCGTGVTTGGEEPVNPKEDPSFISPPQVIDPLYGCASKVSVRNSIIDAKVSLFINGNLIDSKISNSTIKLEFDTPVLVIGDVVTASQEYNGAVSALSPAVVVKDYKEDYPDGLPKPIIDPKLIYECAETIAVRNVPGADITVYVNGGDPVTRGTSTEWNAVWPGLRPFVVGWSFTAEQSLCAEKSDMSDKAVAVDAPSSLNAPSFDPPSIWPGQVVVNLTSLVNGAFTTVRETVVGSLGTITTPISWFPEFDVRPGLGRPIASGDVVTASMALCEKGPPNETPPAGRCEAMPAPRIEQPIAGTNFVVVTQSVPGARIRVYDSGGNEIGDGSGTIVILSRAIVAGEALTVVQQVGECTSRTGYVIKATKKKG